MAAAEVDWSEVTGHVITRLRKPKIVPVPASIVKLAQRSWDEKTPLSHTFATKERAEAFAKLMKNAGSHTDPLTSVSVVIDPEQEDREKVNPCIVGWEAGKRRGRTASADS